jgi:hypothetical protein
MHSAELQSASARKSFSPERAACMVTILDCFARFLIQRRDHLIKTLPTSPSALVMCTAAAAVVEVVVVVEEEEEEEESWPWPCCWIDELRSLRTLRGLLSRRMKTSSNMNRMCVHFTFSFTCSLSQLSQLIFSSASLHNSAFRQFGPLLT